MPHGYLRNWDEGWGRSDERDRDRDERGWRGENRSGMDRDRGFILGDRERGDRERGFFWRSGDEDRDRFRSDRWTGQSYWERGPRNFRSHQDDHYLSWRDRQIDALDRDYAEYCREREQQFHQNFDEWRRERRGNHEPLQTGMAQTGQSKDPTGELELTNEVTDNKESQPDPMSAATLGTTSGARRR